MATSDGVEKMVGRLVNAYPKMADTLTGGTVDEWTNALRYFTDDQLRDAISAVVSDERYPPSIAQVVASCRTIAGRDREVRDARTEDRLARDLRFAWDDWDIRRGAGQTGIASPAGDFIPSLAEKPGPRRNTDTIPPARNLMDAIRNLEFAHEHNNAPGDGHLSTKTLGPASGPTRGSPPTAQPELRDPNRSPNLSNNGAR